MWHNNISVIRTHSKNGSQLAWAIVSGVSGWKQIEPGSADGVTNVFSILNTALANNRKVDVYIQSNYIKQATLR